MPRLKLNEEPYPVAQLLAGAPTGPWTRSSLARAGKAATGTLRRVWRGEALRADALARLARELGRPEDVVRLAITEQARRLAGGGGAK